MIEGAQMMKAQVDALKGAKDMMKTMQKEMDVDDVQDTMDDLQVRGGLLLLHSPLLRRQVAIEAAHSRTDSEHRATAGLER